MQRIGTITLAGMALFFIVCVAGTKASEKDIETIPFCQYCGMDRAKFSSTRMLIEYENGTTIGTCSIHCAAVDLAQGFAKTIAAIKVADYRTGRLVDAEKATWLVGAKLPGVMAAKSRLAFTTKAEAEAFRKEQGGEIADFDAAIASTYCDMWTDTKAIRERRAKGGGKHGAH